MIDGYHLVCLRAYYIWLLQILENRTHLLATLLCDYDVPQDERHSICQATNGTQEDRDDLDLYTIATIRERWRLYVQSSHQHQRCMHACPPTHPTHNQPTTQWTNSRASILRLLLDVAFSRKATKQPIINQWLWCLPPAKDCMLPMVTSKN